MKTKLKKKKKKSWYPGGFKCMQYTRTCRCSDQSTELPGQQGVGHILSSEIIYPYITVLYCTCRCPWRGLCSLLLSSKMRVKIFAFNCWRSLHILNHVPDGIRWSAWSFCKDICWQKIPLEVQVPTKSLRNAKKLSHTKAWAGVSLGPSSRQMNCLWVWFCLPASQEWFDTLWGDNGMNNRLKQCL